MASGVNTNYILITKDINSLNSRQRVMFAVMNNKDIYMYVDIPSMSEGFEHNLNETIKLIQKTWIKV